MICDRCKVKFKVDIFVPHEFWKKIKPLKEGKGGYLCPACIMAALEKNGVVLASLNGFISQSDLDKMAKEYRTN